MAGKKKKKASAPAESPTNAADNAHPLFEFIEEEETVEPLVDPLTAVDLMDAINPLNTMTPATSNNLMDLQMDDWLHNAASFPQPAQSIIPAPSSSNTPLSSLPFTSFGTLSSGLSSQSHNSASLFDAPSESFSFSQTPKHNNSLSVLRDSLRASTDSESAHSQQHASANLLDLSPVGMPISSNSKMLHIPLETGSIDLSLDDVASKLDRLERLQSMFKELEARHKQLSRHTARVNRVLERFTPLKEGIPVDDEAALNRMESFLNDSQLKVKEVALLKDRVKELEIQGKKVFELQAKVSDQEEQIKLLKSQASSASSPQRNGSMDASKPTVNTASVTNSPSHPTPPAAPSFFNFQTLLPTVKSNPPAITTPTAISAVSNAANSDMASPVSPQESTEKSASAVSTLQMKLKLRDLANALKKVTEQRDVAVSRIKELQDAAEISHTSNPSALPITHQSNRRSSVDELIVGIPNSAKSDANSSPLVLVDLGTASPTQESSDDPLFHPSRTSEDLLFGPPSHSSSAFIAHGSRPGTIQTSTNTARLLEEYKTRVKDLETTIEMLRNEVFELSETNKKLRTGGERAAIRRRVNSVPHYYESSVSGVGAITDTFSSSSTSSSAAAPRVSTSSANASSALMLPATAEVSDLEAALLEKQEELKDVEARHAESMKKVEACEARITQLEKDVKRVQDEKNSVEEKLGAIDGVHQVNLDSMAAVHDMTVKTLESDLENMKRLKKLEIEKVLGLQQERDGLEAQREELETKLESLELSLSNLKAANDAAVKSLGESEVSRREIFAELEQAKLKIQGLEMELEATQTKLGAALDDVASLKAEKTVTENALVQASDVEASASADLQNQLETTKTALKETQAKMDKAYAVIRKFKAESEAKSKEIEHQKVKMEELVSQLESAKPVDKESADLEGKLSALQVELQSVQTALSSSVDEAATLRQKLEASESALRTGDLESARAIAETASQCDELKAQVNVLQAKIANTSHVQAHTESLQAQIALLENDVKTAQEALNHATDDRVQSLLSRVADLELALTTSDTDLAELKVSEGRLKAAEAAITAVSSSHANAVEFLDQQLSTIKKTLADAENLGAAAVSKAHEDTDGVKVELASVSESLSAETAKRKSLESQILLLQDEVSSAKAACAEFEKELEKARESELLQNSSSAELVSTLETQILDLNAQLEKSESARIEIRILETRIVDLEGQLEATTRTANTGDQDHVGSDINTQLQIKIEELSATRERCAKLENQLKSTQELLRTSLEDVSAKSVQESNEFKLKISELEANLVDAREDAELLRKAAQSQSSTAIQSTDEEVEGLKHRIADLELLLIAARDALAAPSNEKDANDTDTDTKRRISELESDLSAAQAKLSVASAELVSAKDLLVNDKCVHDDYDAMKARIIELEVEVAQLDQSLASALAEKCTHSDYATLQSRLVSMEAELVQAEQALAAKEDDMRQSAIDHQSKLSSVQESISALNSELESMRQSHSAALLQMISLQDYEAIKHHSATLEARCSELEAKIDLESKQTAVTSAKCDHSDYEALQSRLSELDALILSTKDQLAQSLARECNHNDYEALSAEASQLRASLASQTQVHDANQIESNQMSETLKMRIGSLEEQIASTEIKLAESLSKVCGHGDVDAINVELEALRLELSASQHSSSAATSNLEAMKLEMQSLRALLAETESAKSQLESLLQSSQTTQQDTKTIAQFPDPLQDSSEEIESLLLKITTLETQVADLTTRCHAAEETLALQKQEAHAHVEALLSRETELTQTKSRLTEEEEKKNKSIQLLRNMKAKILKLEDTVATKEGELSALKSELVELRGNVATGSAEQNSKVIMLTKQVDEMGARIRKQNDDLFQLEKQQEAKNAELEKLSASVNDANVIRDKAVAERDELLANESLRNGELDASRATLSLQSQQLTVWHERVKEAEFRLSNLEDELETSKRLFESKSVECEALQMKLSDLEKQFYETEQTVGNNSDEVDQMRREIFNLRKEVVAFTKSVREKDAAVLSLQQDKQQFDAILIRSEKQADVLRVELSQLKSRVADVEMMEDKLKFAAEQLESVKASKESEVNKRTRELRIRLEEFERAVDEGKTRENQLLKLNKSLKDEVRKLARSIGISTPFTSPPLSQQNSGLDAAEVAAANASSSVYKFPARNNSIANQGAASLGSGVDLGGSLNGLNWSGSPVPAGKGATMISTYPTSARTSISSPTSAFGGPPQPGTSSGKLAANDEYLKNVVLRFVESKRDTKLQMIPALGMLLRLTPDEIKRVQKCVT
ncbi:hypothetical protein HDU80_008334 [Chytriomyces hyalinus]|nr:hypothetical protein HDU80_008334 [Chytriomyces hyalinus]